ncbi:MAG TPA: hypothetical protein VKG84_06905 [Candidatus Acidoferrales bacterium]|nr:hypothetical protein [Candidatus Acidoferrales bacterium]
MKNPSSFDLPFARGSGRAGRSGRLSAQKRVVTAADAVRFIDAAGYCLLFPVQGLPLPSLYYACARRECTTWDQYCLRIWKWKDEFGRQRRAFYTKYFKGRGTFISLKLLPHFLAGEGSAFGPGDFDRAYAAGRITADARTIWAALAGHGPMATLELRHACRFETTAGNRRFKKGMLQLSRLLLVVHSGAEQETGAWASSRFELTARAFPAAAASARQIEPAAARRVLAAKYMEWHPQADARTIARLFGWSKAEAADAMGDREA